MICSFILGVNPKNTSLVGNKDLVNDLWGGGDAVLRKPLGPVGAALSLSRVNAGNGCFHVQLPPL